jgi:hypothetical protein
MKKFEFNHRGKSWDRYNAFHAFTRNIVEFETGEVMVIGHPSPDDRHMYDRFSIQLTTTSDADCPNLYFDKECTKPVKKAWLTWKGQQHLAVDHEQQVAVPLSNYWRKKKTTVLGSHVDQATAYWAGAERLPHPIGGRVHIHTPDNEYKKKVLGILNETRVAITAIYRMQKDKNKWWDGYKYEAKLEWQDWAVEDIVADICSEEMDIKTVATKGFKLPRKCEKVDFLYIKGEK